MTDVIEECEGFYMNLCLIHIKALTFFNNICHQGEKNTEKKLARRQLTVKEESSNSWFICVNKILRKYDLKEAKILQPFVELC
jgi:hypothetical protein